MLRHGLQLGSAQLLARLPQISLLTSLPGSSSSSSCSSSSSTSSRGLQQGISSTAAAANETEPATDAPDAPNARQAARELGLDAMPLSKLKEMMADALPQDTPGLLELAHAPARQKRLTYKDVQGYQELLTSLVSLPESHAQDMPKAPMLDAGQWVDAHFKQEGYGFEPRSPFYVWRAWAAAALPLEQAQALVAMESVMADDNARSALLKQAQHELARLWDWQHRRAALGLSPDLPHSSSSSSSAMPGSTPAAADAQSGAAAPAAAAATAPDAAAAQLQEAGMDGSGGSSSSGGDGVAAGLAQEDLAEKGMLELLQSSGALSEATDAQKFEQSLQGSDGAGSSSSNSSTGSAAGSAWLPVEDVVSDSAAKKAAAEAGGSRCSCLLLFGVDQVRHCAECVWRGMLCVTAQLLRQLQKRGMGETGTCFFVAPLMVVAVMLIS
ncbi:hypothetical protein COO60DRAFT_651604 [Scenedesmus sp. NREL 46B-D3]|nr:hypothetical protein COO60DRAFT_651604 [Scenedesmus sp. NREL 46B-D3]